MGIYILRKFGNSYQKCGHCCLHFVPVIPFLAIYLMEIIMDMYRFSYKDVCHSIAFPKIISH